METRQSYRFEKKPAKLPCEHCYTDIARTADLKKVRAMCVYCRQIWLMSVECWNALVGAGLTKPPTPEPPFIGTY